MDEEEVAATGATVGDDMVARGLARALVRRDRRGDDGRTGARELGGDEGDALDVLVAVLAREAELRRQLAADRLSESASLSQTRR